MLGRRLGDLYRELRDRLPRSLRFFTRGLGTRNLRSNDLLSLIMFQPDYLQRLVHLGEEDAEDRRAELLAFVGPPPAPAVLADAPLARDAP